MADLLSPDLGRQVARELTARVGPAVRAVSDEIRRRHPGAVVATLFYGSCLRRQTLEGVLDFFVLVSDYRSAYRSRRLAWLNWLIPPNVFQIEVRSEWGDLRAKYAVISVADCARAARFRHIHPHVWGRFAQPAVAVYTRGTAERALVEEVAGRSIATAVRWGIAFATPTPKSRSELRVTAESLWDEILRRSYATELRTESPAAIMAVVRADPERYQRITAAALELLQGQGVVERSEQHADGFLIRVRPAVRRVDRISWSLRLPLAKTLAACRLLKGVATFDGWLPYALWKLERHTGVRVSLSARQRRHPLIFGWPVLLRALLRGNLR